MAPHRIVGHQSTNHAWEVHGRIAVGKTPAPKGQGKHIEKTNRLGDS